MADMRSKDRGLGGLVADLTREAATLFRQEIQLAKAEMAQKASQAGSGITAAAVGGLIAFVGLLALVAAGIIALSQFWAWWVSALVVGSVILIVGLVVLFSGLAKLKARRLAPTQTIESVRDTQEWARRQIKE